MKPHFYSRLPLFLLVFGLLCSSCSSDEENDFDQSYQTWLDFKETSNNSYHYVVKTWSFVGISTQTKITVSNGIVSKREFEYTQGFDVLELPEEEQTWLEEKKWVEEQDQIGSHANGAEPLTLDEVYDKAGNIWLKGQHEFGSSFSGEVTITFEAENQGMISVCGVTPKNCMDDCFFGIRITEIQKL